MKINKTHKIQSDILCKKCGKLCKYRKDREVKFCSRKCYSESQIGIRRDKNKYIIHGLSYTRFYSIWHGMKVRCEDKTKRYLKKGIKVCKHWMKFENFRDDMYESYLEHCKKFGKKQTTIERVDNNGNYCKENCKWATLSEQMKNRDKRTLSEIHKKRISLSHLLNHQDKQWKEYQRLEY